MTSTLGIDAPSTVAAVRFVGDPDRVAALIDSDSIVGTSVSDDVVAGGAIVLIPRVPAEADFPSITDEALETNLGVALADLLADVQAALPCLDEGGHLIFLLPAEPTLGAPGSAIPGAFCGAALSLTRTLALELARDQITVNTVLHGPATAAIRAGVTTQLLALAGSDAVTGQEIYVTDGMDLGRFRP